MEVGAAPRYESAMDAAIAPKDIETRRRMLLFRAQRRGFREMDLIFGAYSDAHLGRLGAAELDRFEALLDVPDWVLWGWIVGNDPVPAEFDDEVFAQLSAYRDNIRIA